MEMPQCQRWKESLYVLGQTQVTLPLLHLPIPCSEPIRVIEYVTGLLCASEISLILQGVLIQFLSGL